jgi:hypothetical protein
VTDQKTAAQRVVLALQASGLNQDEATAAVEEVKVELYESMWEELEWMRKTRNPYGWRILAHFAWDRGLIDAAKMASRRWDNARTTRSRGPGGWRP